MSDSKNHSTGTFAVIAVSPIGFPNARLTLAADTAGFRGAVALECLPLGHIDEVLSQLAGTGRPYSVSIGRSTPELKERLRSAAQKGLQCVILTHLTGPAGGEEIESLQRLGLQVYVEAVNEDEARLAIEGGADALIVKGQESGGRIGEETSFILLQRVLGFARIPVFARGGIGLHTGAACLAAGAAGVVLDWQLALADESNLPAGVRAKIARMDGSETAILAQGSPVRFRAYARPGETAFYDLRKFEEGEALHAGSAEETLSTFRDLLAKCVAAQELLSCGQDACFAAPLATEFRTVQGICGAIRREAFRQLRVATRKNAHGEGGPLARSHGLRYPIFQGPMTRVSDRADFAHAVAAEGGLPFLALALMAGKQVAQLLDETREKLGDLPWGVGILGFVPKELRDVQLAEVKRVKPRFAIIAGGRPDMAKEFEQEGTATYLHVPSPELLRNFLEQGARRVIFEGRECGGHVGPRASFVLWEQMVRVILTHLRTRKGAKAEDYHFVFAGGIHDAGSAAMLSAIIAPLTERGVQTGVLLGTAYLFTQEAVKSGAITPAFQREAIACRQTILVESGVGHATRCADTPFGEAFASEKRRLMREGKPKEEIREKLEGMNLGRLRIASKGIERRTDPDGRAAYGRLDEETQRREGMYMIGQVAALRDRVVTVAALHGDVSRCGEVLRARLDELSASVMAGRPQSRPADVAIVGFSSIFPKAGDLDTLWQNILHKRNAVTEVPKERWDIDVYFDPDRRAKDKVYSKWGGFLDDFVFDPLQYGMPPASLTSIEPMQLIMLEMVQRALTDAGYHDRRYNKEEAACIVGTGGGVAEHGQAYGFRSMLPHFVDRAGGTLRDSAELIARMSKELPEWTEDSFAGLLLNVVSGRVANRFDFGAANYIVDAACATALAALRNAVAELETRSSEIVVAASADMMQTAFGYLCFSKTQALSPTGQCRTFDDTADGIVIGEGFVVAILKRLDDAVMDGDKIYAVIKTVAASSDGKDKGLTAPRPIGQMRALERAYRKAEIDPATVGLIEAHGTGTAVGDRTEAEALTTFFGRSGAVQQSIALGSVKSMVGHTKCTAGFAGMVKAAMALHHKILPATIGVTKPNSRVDFKRSPLYLNTETRPWLARLDGAPRRAGVSAFGFGGTNFHTILEEYIPGTSDPVNDIPVREWPAELFLFRGGSAADILKPVETLLRELGAESRPALWDLASAVYWDHGRGTGSVCLAIVADSLPDLQRKLEASKPVLAAGRAHQDPRGIYFQPSSLGPDAKVAFLFPGQGSQSTNMLRELAIAFPPARRTLEEADAALGGQLGRTLSSFIYPVPEFSEEERTANEQALKATNVAQPALGAAGMAMYRVLEWLGITPQMAGGHSYGEFAALCASGAISVPDLIRISELRGRVIVESAQGELGTMAAVGAGEAEVAAAIQGIDGVCLANLNSPQQTVISGTSHGVSAALDHLKKKGIGGKAIPVACAFHSPLVAGAREPLSQGLGGLQWSEPRFAVYSNTTAKPHHDAPAAIRDTLAEHLVSPVRFTEEVTAMYEAGARVFIECGPGKVMTGLASRILTDRPHLAVAMDQPGRPGLLQLVHSLAQLATAGVPLFGARLFEGRARAHTSLAALLAEGKPVALSPTAWVVRNGRCLPAAEYQKAKETAVVKRNVEGRHSGRLQLLHDPASAAAPAASASVAETVPPPAPTPIGIPMRQQPETQLQRAADPEIDVRHEPMPAVNHLQPSILEQAIQGHHRLMSHFLDTHRNVMAGLLRQGSLASASSMQELPAAAPAPAALHSAYRPAPPPVQAVPSPRPARVPATHAAPAPVIAAVAAPAPPPAPVATAVSPAPAPAAASAVPSKEVILQKLLELVSQRTGYPADMLGLDLDLEADLGVDSIKRVEIFGALQNESILPASAVESEIENLSKLKTLQAIADWVEAKARELAGGGTAIAAPQVVQAQAAGTVATRMTVQVLDAPAEEDPSLPFAGAVLINSDGYGVARLLSDKLTAAGVPCRTIQTVEEADEARAALGPISHYVHLSALTDVQPGERSEFLPRLERDLQPLYLLTRKFAGELRKAVNPMVLAATRLGGAFGFLNAAPAYSPASGSVAGFVKTVGREWPEVTARVVDFERAAPAEQIAQLLFAEMRIRDGRGEVGHRQGRRTTLTSVSAPLQTARKSLDLGTAPVVLVTGGARGITADIALEMASHCRPKYVLLGRSPLPPAQEPSDLADALTDKALKNAIIDRMNTIGQRPTPALVEGEFRRTKRDREIRANLAALEAAGSTVEYHAVDVCNEEAFGALIDQVYQTHGRIDGVLHGAGVIEDKLIEDKVPESFARVLAPKVKGAQVLARKLRPADLRFLAFFSSVSARYGNRGQCDYAAANEVLNKLAAVLNADWPGRVVSFDWGPWKTEGGMVSAQLAERFAKAGVEMIEPAAGRKAFLNELLYGPKSDFEVVFGGPLHVGPTPPRERPSSTDEIIRTNPVTDLYLQDHVIDGRPVLPMAMALELFASAAVRVGPGAPLAAVRGLSPLRGVTYADGVTPVNLRLTAARNEAGGVDTSLRTEDGKVLHYRARVDFGQTEPPPPPSRLILEEPQPLPISVAQAYDQWLFHGPLFAGITAVEGLGRNGIIGTIKPSRPADLYTDRRAGAWTIDPVAVDSALQMIILWCRVYLGQMVLPSQLRAYHYHGSLSDHGPLRCEVGIAHTKGSPSLRCQIYFYDQAGNLLGRMEDQDATTSKGLNRIFKDMVSAGKS